MCGAMDWRQVWEDGSEGFVEFFTTPFELGWLGILLAVIEIAVGAVLSLVAGLIASVVLDGLFGTHLEGGSIYRYIAVGFGVLAVAWAVLCFGGAMADESREWKLAKARLRRERGEPTTSWSEAKADLAVQRRRSRY